MSYGYGALKVATDVAHGFKPFSDVDSVFRLIIIATKRNKQLLHGAQSRLEPCLHRHKNTTIALEEVRKGLISYTS